MSLVIATGSNLGDRIQNLNRAQTELSEVFNLIKASRIYESVAVDYTDQADFLNQVLEFEIPNIEPTQVMDYLLDIEKQLGRIRDIKFGPRVIDIDIIFWNNEYINESNLTVPHPRWSERSFVVLPLRELPVFESIKKSFKIPTAFDNNANLYSDQG